jgi:hypothetical protein
MPFEFHSPFHIDEIGRSSALVPGDAHQVLPRPIARRSSIRFWKVVCRKCHLQHIRSHAYRFFSIPFQAEFSMPALSMSGTQRQTHQQEFRYSFSRSDRHNKCLRHWVAPIWLRDLDAPPATIVVGQTTACRSIGSPSSHEDSPLLLLAGGGGAELWSLTSSPPRSTSTLQRRIALSHTTAADGKSRYHGGTTRAVSSPPQGTLAPRAAPSRNQRMLSGSRKMSVRVLGSGIAQGRNRIQLTGHGSVCWKLDTLFSVSDPCCGSALLPGLCSAAFARIGRGAR